MPQLTVYAKAKGSLVALLVPIWSSRARSRVLALAVVVASPQDVSPPLRHLGDVLQFSLPYY